MNHVTHLILHSLRDNADSLHSNANSIERHTAELARHRHYHEMYVEQDTDSLASLFTLEPELLDEHGRPDWVTIYYKHTIAPRHLIEEWLKDNLIGLPEQSA